MSKPNLIAERDKRTAIRKKAKKEFDNIITLANRDPNKPTIKLSASGTGKTVRLLDEGMVVDASGNALFYIEKGVLKAFYDNLADDYVGTINLGHMDLATHPIILGQWTKKDLSLVDIGDGRNALDVELKLNDDLNVVQDLRKQPFTLGVSAEFFYDLDWDATERTGLEFLNSVTIKNFAIVGDAGNVNSSGIELKGGTKVQNKEEKLSIKERMANLMVKLGLGDNADPIDPDANSADQKAEGDDLAEKLEAASDALEQRDEMFSLIADLGEEKAALEAKLKEAEEKATALEADKTTLSAELSARDERTNAALERFTKLAATAEAGTKSNKIDNKNKSEGKQLSTGNSKDMWGAV